jgi:hypothetical protein
MKFNVSGRYISGTFNQFVLSNGFDLNLEYKSWIISNTVSYRYNKTANQLIENNWYELFSASYLLVDKLLFATLIYHFDNNLMFQVEERHLVGGGISSSVDWKRQGIRIDLGLGYDHSRYSSGQFENTDLTSPIRSRPIFISRLLLHNRFFGDKFTLTNDLFYRHSLVEKPDYFFLLSSKISLPVFKSTLLFVNHEIRYENVHLTSISQSNSTLLFGLTIRI